MIRFLKHKFPVSLDLPVAQLINIDSDIPDCALVKRSEVTRTHPERRLTSRRHDMGHTCGLIDRGVFPT
jgi:hypothetical protein